ncbi:MAG: GxxExxY protein [Ignavibacteriales bacterium]|nr:GxxExxY protein [Ignavibacteriales bacterium]
MEEYFPFKLETHTIIGICMEVHSTLGKGLLEIVYKDAIELDLKLKSIPYEREKEFSVLYKGVTLPHKFYADFVLYGSIILEVKAQRSLADEHHSQLINYLKISKCKIGLVVNFGESSLKYKRIIL